MSRYLVTSALPYANGPVHLGHVAGAYLPADIYARWLRLTGEEVLFICGTDEHGTPITITADQEGTTPDAVVARYHADQDRAFQSLDIDFDIYSGTSTCPHHAALAQEFFSQLHARGDIAPQDTQQYFCIKDRRFLPDRYVEGRCPKCGNPEARGDQCEDCGEPLRELQSPRCKLCGATPELRATRHWFFHLERYAERLTQWLDSRAGWREQVVRFARNFVPELKPRSITRDLAWGVDVPLPDAEGKKLYVWFDAPIGYVSFTRELGERRGDPDLWERWWKDPATRVVHFIGKDNIVFHAVIWPAMLMGMGGYALPWDVPANEWLNLPEGKFSKSAHRGRSVHEAVAEWSADALRYYLTAIAPETRDSVFTPEDLVTRNDSELADIIGNFAQRGLAFVARHAGGRVPGCGPSDALRPAARAARDAAGTSCGARRFREALRAVVEFARACNKYVDDRAPWATRATDAATTDATVATMLAASADLSVLLFPFLPGGARRWRTQLGLPADPAPGDWGRVGEGPGLAPGIPLPRPEILFPKYADAKRRDDGAKEVPMPDAPAPAPAPTPAPAPPTGIIGIDDFLKVKLRVAKIVAAEKHPNADKLLKIRVDLGTEQRQVVAGIAPWYAPEQLVGKSVIVVANLKPAKLRGEESNGMLLAATDPTTGRVVVLSPAGDAAPGSEVR